jgi:hypothetical protein
MKKIMVIPPRPPTGSGGLLCHCKELCRIESQRLFENKIPRRTNVSA